MFQFTKFNQNSNQIYIKNKLGNQFIKYCSVRRFSKAMDNTKRPLRNARKPPTYLASDLQMLNLQEDHLISGSNNQNKSKDTKNSASNINAMAKLLVNFISQININICGKKENINLLKNGKEPCSDMINLVKKKKDKKYVSNSIYFDHNKAVQNLGIKKLKDSSERVKNKNQPKNMSQYTYNIMKMKPSDQYNPFPMDVNNQYIPYASQFNGIQQMYNLKNLNLKVPGSIASQQISQLSLNKLNLFPTAQNEKQNNLKLDVSNKLFKRSSFHVAIAYHIYIKQIKSQGKQIIKMNDLDPTYFAKKLRQDNHQTNQDEPKQEAPL